MADKPTAIRKIVTNADGQSEVVFLDTKTGKKISTSGLKKYEILSNSGFAKPGASPDKDKPTAVPRIVRNDSGTVSTEYVDSVTGKKVTDLSKYNVSDGFSRDLQELSLKAQEADEKASGSGGSSKRDPLAFEVGGNRGAGIGASPADAKNEMSNNYGYMNKPGWMGLTSFAPGPFGLMGKMVNTAVNVNNTAAVNKAREAIGLEKTSLIGGALRDKQGYIGDITYDAKDGKQGVTSPVGFEAETADGRTTLTANEARMRSMLNGAKEATPEEKKQNVDAFQKENPNARGILGRVVSKLSSGTKEIVDGVIREKSPEQIQADRATAEARPKGLAALSPSFESGVKYDHPERGPVNAGLQERTVETMDALATNTPGGINVTSAYRSPEVNAAVDGAQNSLHMTGQAFDVRTRGMSYDEKRDLVERAVMSGAMEIGSYPDESLHVASTQRFGPTPEQQDVTGGVTGMYNYSRFNYGSAPSWFTKGLEESRLAAVPSPRPEMTAPVNNGVAQVDLARGLGFGVDTRSLMAKTLAGEIDPRYTDLSTEEGRQEAMGILSSMENRVGTFGSVDNAITAPNQYSTWNTEEAANTAMQNYQKSPGVYDSLVADYASNPVNNLGFTSYYNDSIASPGWGVDMTSRTSIGTHTFGSLPEYRGKFGSNISPAVEREAPTAGPTGAGAGVKAATSVDLSRGPTAATTTPTGFSSSVSGENANRSTTSSTPSNNTSGGNSFSGSSASSGSSSRGTNNSPSSSGSFSSSSGSTGGFGAGGDRSSAGKSSYGGSGSSLSSSSGSTGGFGVGGDRSSAGKSTSSPAGSKGAASRSDGWT